MGKFISETEDVMAPHFGKKRGRYEEDGRITCLIESTSLEGRVCPVEGEVY